MFPLSSDNLGVVLGEPPRSPRLPAACRPCAPSCCLRPEASPATDTPGNSHRARQPQPQPSAPVRLPSEHTQTRLPGTAVPPPPPTGQPLSLVTTALASRPALKHRQQHDSYSGDSEFRLRHRPLLSKLPSARPARGPARPQVPKGGSLRGPRQTTTPAPQPRSLAASHPHHRAFARPLQPTPPWGSTCHAPSETPSRLCPSEAHLSRGSAPAILLRPALLSFTKNVTILEARHAPVTSASTGTPAPSRRGTVFYFVLPSHWLCAQNHAWYSGSPAQTGAGSTATMIPCQNNNCPTKFHSSWNSDDCLRV